MQNTVLMIQDILLINITNKLLHSYIYSNSLVNVSLVNFFNEAKYIGYLE